MYNSVVKKRYLEFIQEEAPGTLLLVDRAFRQAEEYEISLGKDIYDWTMDEIIEYYQSKFCKTGNSLYNLNMLLKKYAQYCISNNMVNDAANHFAEIDSSIIYKVCTNSLAAKKRLLTKFDLNNIIKDLNNDSDKALILGIFEGILGDSKEELYYLSSKDIDGNKIKLCSGRIVPISDELIGYIKNAEEETEYVTTNKNGDLVTIKTYAEDHGVIKRAYNARPGVPQINQLVNNKLNKLGTYVGFKFNAKAIYNSGKIYACKQYIAEHNCTFEQALISDYVVQRYGETSPIRHFVMKYERFIKGE
mgnify:CR=1 FL=1